MRTFKEIWTQENKLEEGKKSNRNGLCCEENGT